MSDTHYVGRRGDELTVEVVNGSTRRPLPPQETGGFEWGYPGAGPRSLAKALLAERLGEEPLDEMMLALGEELIETLPREGFSVSGATLDAWIAGYQARPDYHRLAGWIVLGALLRAEDGAATLPGLELVAEDFPDAGARAVYGVLERLAGRGARLIVFDVAEELAGIPDRLTDPDGLVMLRDHYGHLYEFDVHTWAERLRRLAGRP